MIVLNKEQVFNIIKKNLVEWYPTLSGEPEIELSLNMKSSDYNASRKTVTFKQHIISFKYENDIPRRLTVSEVNKMLRKEYINSKVDVDVYISEVSTLPLDTDYNQAAVLQAKVVRFDDSVHLSESHIRLLIDVALDNKDKEWFDELVGQLNIK